MPYGIHTKSHTTGPLGCIVLCVPVLQNLLSVTEDLSARSPPPALIQHYFSGVVCEPSEGMAGEA